MSLSITVDPEHGGRWESLRSGDREWLWQHPDPAIRAARRDVTAGDGFVDAGGVEECFPTVRGRPDHGAVWSRPWQRSSGSPATDRCDPGETTLQRMISETDRGIGVDYRIDGPPGYVFVHAVHALLDLSDRARIQLTGHPQLQVLDHPSLTSATWPQLADIDVSYLTPVDGTAYALIIDCSEVVIIDGPDRLRLRWSVIDGSAPTSLLYWRNLRGWPQPNPYRTIGIEPLIGSTAELSPDGTGAARIGPDGCFSWRLELSSS